MEGDGQFLQCDLDGTLCGGHRVGHRQLLPGEVVLKDQSFLGGQGGEIGAHHPGAHQLAGPQRGEQLLQLPGLVGQRGVEQAALLLRRQRQDQAVGQFHPRRVGLHLYPRQRAVALQGPGMYCVAVGGQQLRQFGLPQIAPRHPQVQFMSHGKPSVPSDCSILFRRRKRVTGWHSLTFCFSRLIIKRQIKRERRWTRWTETNKIA